VVLDAPQGRGLARACEGYLAHPCLFLSNVVAVGKGRNPHHCESVDSHMRQLAATCLVLQRNDLSLSHLTML
jgi:hypothetical protein